MRMYDKAGRSRWPYVIGAAVVIVAVAGGIVYTSTRPPSTPNAGTSGTPTSSPSASTPAPSGSSGAGDGEDDVAPTGCLGGLDRNAAMVLAAQKSAKHTTSGAVEVAAAFYRFLWQYPYPPAQDVDTVGSSVIAGTATHAWKDIAAGYAAAGDNPTQGYLSAATPFHVSTTNGLWRVAETSTADRVNVETAVGYVVDGELSPTKVAGIGLVVVWQDDSWHVESGSQIDQAKLAAGGNRYTAGC